MTIVEKNDVDISPLFAWSKRAFEIEIGDREPVTVYMRVLGDADMGKARVASLRRSAELRRKLRDLDSDERMAYIKDIEDIDVDSLISVIVVFSMRDLSERANDRITIKVPKAPKSDAKTEAHEKYQKAIDDYPNKRSEEFRKLLDEEILNLKASLEKESKETLYNKYVSTLINEMCEQELILAFREWCCYLGSYADEELRIKLFEKFEDFANLPAELKKQFMEEYSSLELYGDELKKLRRVTP